MYEFSISAKYYRDQHVLYVLVGWEKKWEKNSTSYTS